MSELATQNETELQVVVAEAAIEETDLKSAAKRLGLSENDFKRVLGQPGCQRSMRRYRERQLKGSIANLAMRTVEELLKSGPPAVKAGLARWVLEGAGHGIQTDSADQRRLEELGYDELQAIVRQVDGETERRAVVAAPIARSAG